MWFKSIYESAPERLALYAAQHPDGRCVAAACGFDTNSVAMLPGQRLRLQPFATHFKEYSSLELFARADRVGRPDHNLRLSRQRATVVRQALVGMGIPVSTFGAATCRAVGEGFDEYAGKIDGAPDRGGRTVWLFAWPSIRAYFDGPISNFGTLVDYCRRNGMAV